LSERIEGESFVRACRGENYCPNVSREEIRGEKFEREKFTFTFEQANGIYRGRWNILYWGDTILDMWAVAHEYPDREEPQQCARQTGRIYIGLLSAVTMTTLG